MYVDVIAVCLQLQELGKNTEQGAISINSLHFKIPLITVLHVVFQKLLARGFPSLHLWMSIKVLNANVI